MADTTKKKRRWDETPDRVDSNGTHKAVTSKWDETPQPGRPGSPGTTTTSSWDMPTPKIESGIIIVIVIIIY